VVVVGLEIRHPREGEQWIFADVQYLGKSGFKTGFVDRTGDSQRRLVEIHFDNVHPKSGITIMVLEKNISKEKSLELVQHYAKPAFKIENIRTEPQVLSMEDSPVTIHNHSSSQFIDQNLIIVGDRAGASSPLSGMGATLALSSYPVAVREFARALQEPFEARAKRIQCANVFLKDSADKWLDSARANKQNGKVLTVKSAGQ
jgi:flavin-dependent dehydrogenase